MSNAETQNGSVGKVSKFNMIYNGMENEYTRQPLKLPDGDTTLDWW